MFQTASYVVWLRSANASNTTNFWYVNANGGGNNNNASNSKGVCVGSYPSGRVTERRKQYRRIEGV